MSSGSEKKCGSCQRPQSNIPAPLKKCARCHKQNYCSRECQKADWKNHKSTCRRPAVSAAIIPGISGYSTSNSTHNRSSPGPCSIPNPFTALENKTWLKNRPEHDVFKLLVDVHRMRIEDEHKFDGDVDEDTILGGGTPATALGVFREFLEAMTRLDTARPVDKKILPEWWNAEKLNECVKFARDGGNAMSEDNWSRIALLVEKHDVQEHYKDMTMPMQLRMFSYEVDGALIMGQSGSQMRADMIDVERGNAHAMVINMA